MTTLWQITDQTDLVVLKTGVRDKRRARKLCQELSRLRPNHFITLSKIDVSYQSEVKMLVKHYN